jgi:hypothetical protein
MQILLTNWINSLGIWRELSVKEVVSELKTGVLLCKLIKFHQPSIRYVGLNERPKAKNACINNIEKILSVMWQKKALKRVIHPYCIQIRNIVEYSIRR